MLNIWFGVNGLGNLKITSPKKRDDVLQAYRERHLSTVATVLGEVVIPSQDLD